MRSRLLSAASAIAWVLPLLVAGCSKPTQPLGAAPTPILGLSANPPDAYVSVGDSLVSALLTAKATGATLATAGEIWRDLEASPGAIDGAAIRLRFAAYRSLGFEIAYNLRIVDTNQRTTPPDLASTAWDDPAMLARVDALVDTVIAAAAVGRPLTISLGNEVDIYFAAHPTELAAWRSLIARERDRIHAALPGVRVGCCTTWQPGASSQSIGQMLNADLDLSLYTYYPFVPASDFQHRPTSTFEGDVAAMLAANPSKPIALQEVGYSSSAGNGSSPAAQADFVRRFRGWVASQPRTRVLFANWFLMTDWSSATLSTLFAYYGFTSPGFAAYLGGLGLRDSSGGAKEAWSAWRAPP